MADTGIKASDLSAAVSSITNSINALTKAMTAANASESTLLQATTQNMVKAINSIASNTNVNPFVIATSSGTASGKDLQFTYNGVTYKIALKS